MGITERKRRGKYGERDRETETGEGTKSRNIGEE
jgi:hypothetical protein